MTTDYHPVLQIFQKLEISKSDVIFKIHIHISLDQENKAKLYSLDKAAAKIQLEILQNCIGKEE